MRLNLQFPAWFVLFLTARLAAQPFPPPVSGGLVDIAATVGTETSAVQYDYLPPKSATILAETLHRTLAAKITATATEQPGTAGETTASFTFDSNYAAGHPNVIRPMGTWELDLNDWFYHSYYQYSKVTKKTTWDAQGQITFSLQAKRLRDGATDTIEGIGAGAAMMAVDAPSFWPTKFNVRDITSVSGDIGRFKWAFNNTTEWRYLLGIQGYFFVTQADGTEVVFHLNHFTGSFEGSRDYYPIGELTVAGTPGQGKGVSYQISVEPLTEAGAYDALKQETWSFTGNFEPTPGASAHYAFSSSTASASKLRYKVVVQPGLARTVTWHETFTPEGASEPSDIRLLSENVTATATETQVHTIDPFARFGAQAGTYQVQAFEAESFEAGLTVDANRDGQILPAAGPMTPYVIANADLISTEKPYGFRINADDDDGDGVADNIDLQVNGPADLADFFPVFLNIKQILSTLPAGTKCILRQADGALNFVYTDLKQAKAFDYLNNPGTGFGPHFDQPAATATAQQITSAGVELSEEFVNRIRYQNQGVILVEFRASTQQPLTLTIQTGTGVYVMILPLQATLGELAVDANRDGQIKDDGSDATSIAQPYRFWINDDDDSGDDKRTSADDIPLPEGDNNRDSVNGVVDGIRDLEDFFPVFLDLKLLLSKLPPGTNGVSYFLKQEEEAVGVVFTSYTRTQAFDYLRGAPANLDTGFGPTLSQKAGEATVTKVTAAGVDIFTLSSAFLNRIQSDGGVLLVEASKIATKPLILEVRKGPDVIAEVKLELKTDPVETMFHYHNIRSLAHGTAIATEKQGPNYGVSTPKDAPNDPFQSETNRKNVVFVHGYNVNGEGARGSAATVFKRFYWSGSKAKLYAVLWRGDDGQGLAPSRLLSYVVPKSATPDYHRNVGHAWQQGLLLRNFLGTLQGDTAIIAHSLGNVVTQVALTRASDPNNAARLMLASKPATVKHYFAVDAAVPLEATSASDITIESKGRLRHSWWAEYDNLECLWPTAWHALFKDTDDGRGGLTWQNIFANLEVGTNFYSSGEEVLANPENDGMPFWEPLFLGGRHAWVAQEKLKGGNGAAAPFFRSWTAGWVENEEWYVPIVPTPPLGSPQKRRLFASEAQVKLVPAGVPSAALASEPFFQRFQATEDDGFYPGYQGSRLHAPVGDANADDEARKLVTIAKCLGEAIPALSYAQGRNHGSAFDRAGMGGNIDLNSPAIKNGWPISRGLDPEDQVWKHSDCVDVAYIYHFKFYDRMKNDGGLQ